MCKYINLILDYVPTVLPCGDDDKTYKPIVFAQLKSKLILEHNIMLPEFD